MEGAEENKEKARDNGHKKESSTPENDLTMNLLVSNPSSSFFPLFPVMIQVQKTYGCKRRNWIVHIVPKQLPTVEEAIEIRKILQLAKMRTKYKCVGSTNTFLALLALMTSMLT